MSIPNHLNTESVFASLDGPFIRYDKKGVEPILWQAKDMLVQRSYELKIPALSGSTIKYSFSTTIGDISFATKFSSPGHGIEDVIQSMRVPSDSETINGSFKSIRDGVFFLIFDNNFSWFNPKMLTYQISLFQPAFTIADSNRCIQSKRLLSATIEDTRRAEIRLIKSQERSIQLNSEIKTIESRLESLLLEIDQKKNVLKAATEEVNEMTFRIKNNIIKKSGLCIRCLDKKLTSEVLSYLGKESSVVVVSKYWNACIDDYGLQKQKKLAIEEFEDN